MMIFEISGMQNFKNNKTVLHMAYTHYLIQLFIRKNYGTRSKLASPDTFE